MIYSHGNGCDIGEMRRDMVLYSQTFRVNVLCYEYPGYGIFPGSASSDGCISSQKVVYNFLTKYMGVDPGNIVLFGRSIGSGISSDLCSKRPVGGLVLQR